MPDLSITATRIASGLDQPLYVTAPPGDTGRLFIVEKTGAILVLDLGSGGILEQPFLDLSGEVSTGGEQGLLGLAFHPDYAGNGVFYVNLTNRDGDTEIRAYRVSADDPNRADPAGSLVMTVDQPFANHNGGWLGFGPDGYLYIALGDGGSGGDPQNHAQNLDSLLGKILRIDVSADAFPGDGARNYAIPPDNPFAATPGADEIWAYGLRNPWRASFDSATGTLFIADVGQGAREEVDIGIAGGNYGWPTFEGDRLYSSRPLTGGDAIAPIAVYDHSQGFSITGGYVYRGPSTDLQGLYFYADFGSARVWTLQHDGSGWVSAERTSQIVTTAGTIDSPASFGEDAFGNLYVVDLDGEVFRLTGHAVAATAGEADVALAPAPCGPAPDTDFIF